MKNNAIKEYIVQVGEHLLYAMVFLILLIPVAVVLAIAIKY